MKFIARAGASAAVTKPPSAWRVTPITCRLWSAGWTRRTLMLPALFLHHHHHHHHLRPHLPHHHRLYHHHSHHNATIYALSSAPGRAAIAVIRISGPACLHVYQLLCPARAAPQARVATVRSLYEPGKPANRDHILDPSALLLYFPAPATATGEDVLELHIHAGPAIIRAVLTAISRCQHENSGPIRYAEPGEFTRRAFMNGRIDLTQVEALGHTLSADTEQQRRLSVRGAAGKIAKHYEAWGKQLLYARGELEALIDFSEDQHFDESPKELMGSVAHQVLALKRALLIHSQNAVRGELLRHGITVSLLGPPNAGKSSLLNRIVGREAAIVSHEAGTTRDIVEIGLDVGGYFCRIGDTAGLRRAIRDELGSYPTREVVNKIEQEGMRRAKERAADSHLVIIVLSFERVNGYPTLTFDEEVCAMARRLIQDKDNVIVVLNKSDFIDSHTFLEKAIQQTLAHFPALSRDSIYPLSCTSAGAEDLSSTQPSIDHGGIQRFLQGLIQHFRKLTTALTPSHSQHNKSEASSLYEPESDVSIWQESLGASERHRILLDECIRHLDAFLSEAHGSSSTTTTTAALTADYSHHHHHHHHQHHLAASEPEADIVIAAEHLRAAAACLAKITGRGGEAGDAEEVLGVVFEKFCVGK